MAKQRIRTLMLGPSEKVTARNSHTGMFVIADYVSDEDGQRYLVFERQGTATPSKRKAGAKTQPETTSA